MNFDIEKILSTIEDDIIPKTRTGVLKGNKIFADADEIYSSGNILDDFYKMLLNQHFIVGNSTFSLMAAFLKEELDTKIIVADPWFRGEENKDFIKDNWIKINNV